MKRQRTLSILVVLALRLSLTSPGFAAEVTVSEPQAAVEGRIVPVGAITYGTEMDGLHGSLVYLPTDNSLLLKVGEPEDQPTLDVQAKFLDVLFAAVLRSHPDVPQFDLLLRDRDEIIQRLQRSLTNAPNWDGGRGRTRQGNMDVFFANIINDGNLARELSAVFAQHGYMFRVHSLGLVTEDKLPAYHGALMPTGIARIEFYAAKIKGRV